MAHELGGTQTVAPHPLVKREESTTKLSVQARFQTGSGGRREPGRASSATVWMASDAMDPGAPVRLPVARKARNSHWLGLIVAAPSHFGTVLHRTQRVRRALQGPVTLAGHAWHDHEGRGGRRPLLPAAPSAEASPPGASPIGAPAAGRPPGSRSLWPACGSSTGRLCRRSRSAASGRLRLQAEQVDPARPVAGRGPDAARRHRAGGVEPIFIGLTMPLNLWRDAGK